MATSFGCAQTSPRCSGMSKPAEVAAEELFSFAECDGWDGYGWYYWWDEYPDEGSVGAFWTRDEALQHAVSYGVLDD